MVKLVTFLNKVLAGWTSRVNVNQIYIFPQASQNDTGPIFFGAGGPGKQNPKAPNAAVEIQACRFVPYTSSETIRHRWNEAGSKYW